MLYDDCRVTYYDARVRTYHTTVLYLVFSSKKQETLRTVRYKYCTSSTNIILSHNILRYYNFFLNFKKKKSAFTLRYGTSSNVQYF